MTDLILGIIIGVLFIDRYFNEKRHAKEKHDLINAIIAKHAGDKAQLDAVNNVELKETTPEFVATDNLTDEQWEEVVNKEA